MFLTQQDYQDHVQADVLNKVINADLTIRTQTELKVQSLIESYLNVRYDISRIFNKSGSARNQTVLMYMVDMVVYRVYSRVAPSQVPQHVNDKYTDALNWLKMVAAGKLEPDLPKPAGDSEGSKFNVKYGSERKRNPYY
ncbi:hypothetical protein C900_05369 [Fulvivirga imtechensis AK7]|uniref:DUF1320 domain-containing protein n=1 Tax=Fulvivirga imtechensis AK7 TaxID=1237149 RepID=L8JLQ8_9BACT|nr:phage protein Gp36 family protein [Fulvivirga imtechensis]ELR69173.1 hypothetical protein C900_05369 [Fulvivirga imtechensis AK7]